jgi:hypothetical protein
MGHRRGVVEPGAAFLAVPNLRQVGVFSVFRSVCRPIGSFLADSGNALRSGGRASPLRASSSGRPATQRQSHSKKALTGR